MEDRHRPGLRREAGQATQKEQKERTANGEDSEVRHQPEAFRERLRAERQWQEREHEEAVAQARRWEKERKEQERMRDLRQRMPPRRWRRREVGEDQAPVAAACCVGAVGN